MRGAQQVSVVVAFYIYIEDVLGSTLGQATAILTYVYSLFYSVTPIKCWVSNLIR